MQLDPKTGVPAPPNLNSNLNTTTNTANTPNNVEPLPYTSSLRTVNIGMAMAFLLLRQVDRTITCEEQEHLNWLIGSPNFRRKVEQGYRSHREQALDSILVEYIGFTLEDFLSEPSEKHLHFKALVELWDEPKAREIVAGYDYPKRRIYNPIYVHKQLKQTLKSRDLRDITKYVKQWEEDFYKEGVNSIVIPAEFTQSGKETEIYLSNNQ